MIEEDVLTVHEVDGKRKQGQPKMKWREQVKGSMRRIDLNKDVHIGVGVGRVAEIVRCIQPPPLTGKI